MAILKEEIKGTKIINEIQSSNIRKSEYDTETNLINTLTQIFMSNE